MEISVCDTVFDGVCDAEMFDIDLTGGGEQLRNMIAKAGVYAMVGSNSGLPGIESGPVDPTAILCWPDYGADMQSAGDCFFMLVRLADGGKSELRGLSLHLETGAPVRARTVAAMVSGDGLQGFVTLEPDGYEGRPLTILHTAFASSYSPGDGFAEYRIIGLPLLLEKVERAPIEIGPDAPSYASMVAAGLSVNDDGIIRLIADGMAVIFPRDDIGPHAYEVGGRVVALRHGFWLADKRYDIAEVAILRDEVGEASDVAISIAVPASFWGDRPSLKVGDDLQGIVLFSGYALQKMAPRLAVSG